MITQIIEKISTGNNLSIRESFEIMNLIMKGECNNSQIAGILLGLKTKGETAEELAGFTLAMREMSTRISTADPDTIDLCGTGGDNSGTFNISTAASFVVAGAGIHVAKHGNGSISSKCGSADVLTEMGVNINLSPSNSERALNEIGITFLFAPFYHPAMKFASTVRKELKIKTIFNLLGPLTNPAGIRKQLIGTFSDRSAQLMAAASKYLEMDSVNFICTDNRYDEISLTGSTAVLEYNHRKPLHNYSLSPDTFNYKTVDINRLKSDTKQNNASLIFTLLKEKKKDEIFYVVAANAAMALKVSGFSKDLQQCTLAAEESIISGNAYKKLDSLIKFGVKHS